MTRHLTKPSNTKNRGQSTKGDKKELKNRDKAENRKKHLKTYHQVSPGNKRLGNQKIRTDATEKEQGAQRDWELQHWSFKMTQEKLGDKVEKACQEKRKWKGKEIKNKKKRLGS